ncbi:hypothetical protein [Rhizobium oryzicola]|uniref:Uncharacterized protein n=1 Tax=Rhizobium oryzicola TaxID=1232668 RepID=A0ABT8SU52_9HYPH|nr:hypothetical protein [Rhizobium oryzicola]MDO1581972.1 hypothetical protein [Rhizobium oryzicola]
MRKVHLLVSIMLATAVPTAGYLVNGSIGLEFIVQGAIIGFAYWYWGPLGLPF